MARALLLLLALAAAGSAADDKTCPYCEDDPAVLAAAGMVSHGPFLFGASDLASVQSQISYARPIGIETPHLRIVSTLRKWKVPEREWKANRAELTALAAKLPEVDPKVKSHDRWLRLHLYAERAETQYRRFQEAMGVTDDDFGASRWTNGRPYMGEGPYLGEKDKFEILLTENQGTYTDYLSNTWGLTTTLPHRHNIIDRSALWFGIYAEGVVNGDKGLYTGIIHNLAHNFLDGYKHYSYDIPSWISEGFAHWMEQDAGGVDYHFCTEEAADADVNYELDWEPSVRKLVRKKRPQPLARMMRYTSYAEISLEDHFTAWSRIDYLMRAHAEAFRAFMSEMAGLLGPDGYADGKDLVGRQRRLLKELLGVSPDGFDRSWAEWVLENYRTKKAR